MSDQPVFDILMLLARPAAGKSEVIDFLKHTSDEERAARFHVGKIKEIDDFPMLWTWYEEDDILVKMGHPRLFTDETGNFAGVHLWDLLTERICLEYAKHLARTGDDDAGTALIEFSRGKEHGGFARAFAHLSQQVLIHTSILYLQVSWEESFRKNRKRFNPNQPDSILEHSLSDEKMVHLYKDSDWTEITAASPDYLTIQGIPVPYVIMDNEDDITTPRGEALGMRLESCLNRLYRLRTSI